MCCHSSPWVSSKTLHVWKSGNASDLIWELQIVSISWNLLQKSNVYNVWRNTKGNGLSVCPAEWTESFLPVLAQMSQASQIYSAESEPKINWLIWDGIAFLTKTCHRLPDDNTTSNFQLWSSLLLFDESTDFSFKLLFFPKLTLNWFLLMCQ